MTTETAAPTAWPIYVRHSNDGEKFEHTAHRYMQSQGAPGQAWTRRIDDLIT